MECILTSEDWKSSTSLHVNTPKEINEIVTLQNSTAAFQILLNSGGKANYVLGNQFSIPDDLETPTYRIVIESELNCQSHFIEYYIGKDSISFADKIIKDTNRVYSGDRWAPIYVEIPINENQTGDYKVSIRVYQASIISSDKLIVEKTMQLHVKNFALPRDSSKDFKLDMWQQPSNLARTFHVAMWGDEHFRLIREMAHILSEIGQKTVTVIGGEIPWKGWFNYIVKDFDANLYEYSMIKVKKDKYGKIQCDFNILDRYLDCFTSEGIKDEIEIFGLLGVWKPPFFPQVALQNYPENIVIRYLNEETGEMSFFDSKSEFSEYIHQLVAHLRSIGVWNKTKFIADEPQADGIQTFKQSIELLKAIEPSIKFKVAFDKIEVFDELKSLIDFPVTSFYCSTAKASELQKFQYYICNYPDKPNTFLHSPLLETRIQGVVTAYLKSDGLLRWAFNCWPNKARTDIRYNTSSLPIGDNCFVYPGDDGHILLSLRYKELQRGIEDFQLIQIAAKIDKFKTTEILKKFLGEADSSKWMLNNHVTSTDLFNQSNDDFIGLREDLLELIIASN